MRSLSTLAILLIAAASAPAQTTVDQLVHDMLKPSSTHPVFPPGKKDTPDNFDIFRLGAALWDTGEQQAGYWGVVQQIKHHSSYKYEVWAPNHPASTVQLVGVEEQVSGPFFHYYDYLFLQDWMRLNQTSDMDILFPTTGPHVMGRLLSVQNTVFSPQRPDKGPTQPTTFYDFGVLGTLVANRLVPQAPNSPNAMRLTQNIGFANNTRLATGEYDFNFEHPLRASPLNNGNHPPLMDLQRADEVDDFNPPNPNDTIPDGMQFWHYPMNMAHPEVASLLAESIAERVRAYDYDNRLVDYNSIGGEFFLGLGPPSKPDDVDPADIEGDTPAETAVNYMLCLPFTDYSEHSLAHFRHWLHQKREPPYADVAALNAAWLTQFSTSVTIEDTLAIDPSQALTFDLDAPAENLQAILNDWITFQVHQHHEAQLYQYIVAKAANPHQPMHNLWGGERGGLETDGHSSNFWYRFEDLLDTTYISPVKVRSIHAASYGEAINFPLLSMPSAVSPPVPDPTCEVANKALTWPTQFRAMCYDGDQVIRTLNEFLTLGVDSVGIAYYKNGFNFNMSNQNFRQGKSLVDYMADQANAQRQKQLLMTPWRSPLLVHAESSARSGTVSTEPADTWAPKVFETLERQQVQYAPFYSTDAIEEFDDLWLTSERKVLLVPFGNLDACKLRMYQDWADDHSWHLVILTDVDTAYELALSPPAGCEPSTSCSAQPPGSFDDYQWVDLNHPGQPNSCNTNALKHRLFVFYDTSPSVIETAVNTDVLPFIEARTSGRAIRPVRAVTTGPSPTHLTNLEMTVACDGINFFVSAVNAGTTTTGAFELAVETLYSPSTGFSKDAANYGVLPVPAGLAPGQSTLGYLPMTLPGTQTATQYNQAIDAAEVDVAALDAAGYDTTAAERLLELLNLVDTTARREKALAGLLRLERMVFVDFASTGSTGSLHAKTLHSDGTVPGLGNVAGAEVQVEFALHRHERRNDETDGSGNVTGIDLLPPSTAETWDFGAAAQGYHDLPEFVVNDPAAAQNVVEIHVLHDVFGTQGATVQVDP